MTEVVSKDFPVKKIQLEINENLTKLLLAFSDSNSQGISVLNHDSIYKFVL